ncbi:DUF4917 family protein [Psychromonas sp. SP041]|uniref:DUF4917 family protein n=1 Tax=Psychromonas sp. SP041 TaxID=1365007 RepID=UPI000427A7F6|nr:DUF4917 family protein [Psychromonas sp. SP041]
MPRKLIIFGNGLGMSLSPEHFSLQNALETIWCKDGVLTSDQKKLIERCLGKKGAPEGEDELDLLHQAISYCTSLNRIGQGDIHWLTKDGQSFPEITAKYIHKVATFLHNYDGELPFEFYEPLIEFVKKTKSHVATLNYDKLLYNSFIDNNIFSGYNGYLADGMIDRGFSSESLERRYGNNFGYYLHLHGSPLFVEKRNGITKLSRDQLTIDRDEQSQHIVLTHVKHKPSVISASSALSVYWDYLRLALEEVEEVILFGYSGLDEHLNVLLKPYLKTIDTRVVEWSGAGKPKARKHFWTSKLGDGSITVTRLDNITEFEDW